jgi:hypothetical protein
MFEPMIDPGDLVAAQLFKWVNTLAPADMGSVELEMRPVVLKLRFAQHLMRVGGYRLRTSLKYSPADLCGMDQVLVSERLDRYFWLDITVDPVIKRELSTLRKRHVFVADTDSEVKTVTLATRLRFLERLIELMEGPTVLTLSKAPYPGLEFESNAEQLLRSISQFQDQLLSYAQSLRGERELRGLILEYREDLNNARTLAEEESNRRLSPTFIVQERTLLAHLPAAIRTAWSATIAGKAYPWKPRLGTHGAKLDMRRGQVVVVVNGQHFRLDGVIAAIVACEERVWSERAKRKPVDFEQKRRLNSDAGRKLVAENLVRVIESTPLSTLIGNEDVAPPVAASAAAQLRWRSARPTPQ